MVRFLVLFAILFYILAATGMSVINKYILSVFHFKFPNILFLWQNIVVLTIQLTRVNLGQI
jgi:hypothetical protein